MRANDFNSVAFFYDMLVRLVFGSAMIKAQTFYLNAINDHSRILVIGGGTGWILKSIPPNAEVWFVDASSEMIRRAAKQDVRCKVHFIEGTEDSVPEQLYDAVITNFYLDLFTDEKAFSVIKKLKHFTKPTSTWIATDFIERTWLHKLLLKIMFMFFRVTSKIESKVLPDWEGALQRNGFIEHESKTFYSGFIKTTYYTC